MEKDYANVKESWPIYDTILVCKQYYGKEQNVNGWFNSFLTFAQQEKHQFFKSRTAGSTHLAYCNMQSADNIDFAYLAYSFGVRFFAPVIPEAYFDSEDSTIKALQESLNAFWLFDLPNHCGVDFRAQQDVIVENNCSATPPGYGPRGGGGAQGDNFDLNHYALNAEWDTEYWWQQQAQDPWQITIGSQSEPVIDCRFPFPKPVKIARNSTIEANVYVSLYARHILEHLYNGLWYFMSGNTMECCPDYYVGKTYTALPPRWGIQVSLYGLREVQQRGQYHAPGAIISTPE